MPNFFHVYVVPKQGVTRDQLEVKLNKALDWFRYASANYVVYSSANVDILQKRLIELVEPDGSLFISKLDLSVRNGWMTREFWEWLNKERPPRLGLDAARSGREQTQKPPGLGLANALSALANPKQDK